MAEKSPGLKRFHEEEYFCAPAEWLKGPGAVRWMGPLYQVS